MTLELGLHRSLGQLATAIARIQQAVGTDLTSTNPTNPFDAPDTSLERVLPPESETVPVAVNATCPIMGGKVTDEGGRTEWNGQTVGFCCPDCIADWNELSDEDKTSKLAEASESSGHDHGDHGSDHN